jgi:hypothetical protein
VTRAQRPSGLQGSSSKLSLHGGAFIDLKLICAFVRVKTATVFRLVFGSDARFRLRDQLIPFPPVSAYWFRGGGSSPRNCLTRRPGYVTPNQCSNCPSISQVRIAASRWYVSCSDIFHEDSRILPGLAHPPSGRHTRGRPLAHVAKGWRRLGGVRGRARTNGAPWQSANPFGQTAIIDLAAQSVGDRVVALVAVSSLSCTLAGCSGLPGKLPPAYTVWQTTRYPDHWDSSVNGHLSSAAWHSPTSGWEAT